MNNLKEYLVKMLRWSEKYTKTDMLYVAKNGFWSALGQMLSITFVFLLSVIFAHFLPKNVYGNYKFIISTTSVLGSFALSGMATAIVQAVSRGKEGVVKTAIRTSLRWGLVTFVLSVFLAFYYWLHNNPSTAIAIMVAGIANPLISTYGLYTSVLAGKKDFRTSTFFITCSQILNTVVLAITAVITSSALILVIVTFSTNVLSYFSFYVLTLKKYPLNNEGDPSMIGYGKHVSAMNVFSALANQIDKILVFHYLGATELAIYSFAIAIPEQIRGSYKGIFNIALPKFSEREGGLKHSLWQKTKSLTLITSIVIILYVLLAPFVYNIFFPKYLESIWYSRVYVIALITVPGISLFSTYFSVKKETTILYWISIITNTSTLILSYYLIKNYGLLGAVLENTISWTIMLIVNGLFFLHHQEKLEL